MVKFLIFWIICIGCTINLNYAQQRCGTIYDPSKMKTESRQIVERFFKSVGDMKENPEGQSMMLNNFDPNRGIVLIPVIMIIIKPPS